MTPFLTLILGSAVGAAALRGGPLPSVGVRGGPLPYQMMQLYTVKNAVARGAVCNDGSPAAYYYRNCTANGDRRVSSYGARVHTSEPVPSPPLIQRWSQSIFRLNCTAKLTPPPPPPPLTPYCEGALAIQPITA